MGGRTYSLSLMVEFGDDAVSLEHAFGCVSKYESGNGGFVDDFDAVSTGPRFLRPLGTQAYTVRNCLLGFFADGWEF